ncbi:MAG: hypothetical protein QOG43_2151 [Actinomycetota bacterium]|jgi:hypothetical protein|nr:hypothetical protein [Actinomycetota bacterium]
MTAHRLSPTETARRSHSIASAIRAAVTVWYAVLGGIGAWIIHLMVLVSVVRFTCNTRGYGWVMHLTTGVTLAMTAAAMVLSRRLLREGEHQEGTAGERNRFLGRLGLIVGAANGLLIALEGLYVVVLGSRRCG